MQQKPANPDASTSEPHVSNESRAVHTMPFGASLLADGSVRFRVWAPEAATLHVALDHLRAPIPMQACSDGWHELVTFQAAAGSRYRFVLPSGLHVPDPASRYQPEDVNGPSEVIDPAAYSWRSLGFRCCPWENAVLYELHIGTFTPEGTFRAAINKLDHLSELGVTAIEIMALGDFAGRWNWGYDGVLLYAPDSSYGHPNDLKALVDAAHDRGIMVILDVVYNHFGPEGNYIAQYFPDIVTNQYQTPWGQALNFDAKHSENTREFIIHNALYWIEEFRMDGLRLDAVHAIIDSSPTHILDEIASRVRSIATGRPIHLILESDDRVWHHLGLSQTGQNLFTAQWNHDSQQLLALALTHGRPEDQDRESSYRLCRALVEGFTSGPHHRNTPQTWLQAEAPPSAAGFISFLQTHDVVGNRIAGERITDLAAPEIVRAIAAVYLLAPQIPMLFMGEEWASSSPFPFFCDFHGDLADAVRKGRLEQFASLEQRTDPAFLASAPDPIAEQTFLSAKLKWLELATPSHADWFAWYRRILACRRREIIPHLHLLYRVPGRFQVLGPRRIQVQWSLEQELLQLDANLAEIPNSSFSTHTGRTLWLEGAIIEPGTLAPWSVRWSSQPS